MAITSQEKYVSSKIHTMFLTQFISRNLRTHSSYKPLAVSFCTRCSYPSACSHTFWTNAKKIEISKSFLTTLSSQYSVLPQLLLVSQADWLIWCGWQDSRQCCSHQCVKWCLFQLALREENIFFKIIWCCGKKTNQNVVFSALYSYQRRYTSSQWSNYLSCCW